MKYSEIESHHIRGRVSETRWDDRQYIDDLVVLCRFVAQEPTSAVSARLRGTLVERYPDDWLELCREHSDEKYREQLALREETTRARARVEAGREAEEAEARAEWLKAGGRP